MTTEQQARKLKTRVSNLAKKRGQLQKAVNAESKARKRLNERQKRGVGKKTSFKCHCCGKRLNNPNLKRHYDHIRAKSTGGSDGVWNFLLSCETCNWGRKAKLPEEIHLLLALGEMARSEIERDTELGATIAQAAVRRPAIKTWLSKPASRN